MSPLRRALPLAVLAALALAPAAPATAAQLKAGAAVADITPASGGTTLGFVRPDVTVTGVHTRLAARALVLDDGDTKVALLATDLAFPLQKEALVARLKDRGFDHASIFYTGTHTHSGPGDLAPWQVEQIATAIRTADDRRVPARAAWSNGKVRGVARNRSIEAHLANYGIDQFYGQGHERDAPGGPESTRDDALRVLRVESVSGRRPIAAWMESAVHVTTSTPAVDLWDSDLAGAAEVHLQRSLGADPAASLDEPGFVALWNNGASGDLMPVFDSFNPTATMDVLGRRIAREARRQWDRAGRRLTADVPLDLRWTRACFCGQEVEPGRRVDSKGQFGLPFLGGSEDGASIFHEPVQTEGRRTSSSDPVQGRKIVVPAPTDAIVHEREPELHAVRIGDRLLLGAPGEPSVMMARRFVSAVHPYLPKGVRDVVLVGLTNDYMGYLTTPEEYEMQHYEGGHTVFGKWTSLLARDAFIGLTRALADDTPAPAPSSPGGLGSTDPGTPSVGGGGPGALVRAPSGTVERGAVLDVEWSGAAGGVDRRLDKPTLLLERRQSNGAWRAADTDLGLGWSWREADGRYTARYDVPLDLAPGTYRTRVVSGGYDLPGEPLEVVAHDELRPRGATTRPVKGGRVRVVVLVQNPKPDPDRAILHRERSAQGGRAVVRVAGKRRVARWNEALGGYVVTFKRRRPLLGGASVVLGAGAVRDAAGNRSGPAVTLTLGQVRPTDWPPNMLVGGGRTPGPGGSGEFPP